MLFKFSRGNLILKAGRNITEYRSRSIGMNIERPWIGEVLRRALGINIDRQRLNERVMFAGKQLSDPYAGLFIIEATLRDLIAAGCVGRAPPYTATSDDSTFAPFYNDDAPSARGQ